MGTYEGSVLLIAANGTEWPVKHASIRTRADRTRPGISTWEGRLELSDSDSTDAPLPAGEGILRLPDGSEATVQVGDSGAFTGTGKPRV